MKNLAVISWLALSLIGCSASIGTPPTTSTTTYSNPPAQVSSTTYSAPSTQRTTVTKTSY